MKITVQANPDTYKALWEAWARDSTLVMKSITVVTYDKEHKKPAFLEIELAEQIVAGDDRASTVCSTCGANIPPSQEQCASCKTRIT